MIHIEWSLLVIAILADVRSYELTIYFSFSVLLSFLVVSAYILSSELMLNIYLCNYKHALGIRSFKEEISTNKASRFLILKALHIE
jgi:hypothetical protein